MTWPHPLCIRAHARQVRAKIRIASRARRSRNILPFTLAFVVQSGRKSCPCRVETLGRRYSKAFLMRQAKGKTLSVFLLCVYLHVLTKIGVR